MKPALLIGALMLSLSILPVQAQNKDDTVAAARQPAGEVRTSRDGAEFVTLNPGQRLKAGDRVMVGRDSEVTLRFDNGCDRVLDKAGVFTVDGSCAAGILWRDAAIVAGSVTAAALLLDNMDKVPGPPVSR